MQQSSLRYSLALIPCTPAKKDITPSFSPRLHIIKTMNIQVHRLNMPKQGKKSNGLEQKEAVKKYFYILNASEKKLVLIS